MRKVEEKMRNDCKIKLLERKIEKQIRHWEREMNKRDKQFDFFEGIKIEAEIILSWLRGMEDETNN